MCVDLYTLPLLFVSSPDDHKLLLAPSASELFPCNPQSQLVRWKHITIQEVQVCVPILVTVIAVSQNDLFLFSL